MLYTLYIDRRELEAETGRGCALWSFNFSVELSCFI